eukprot:gene32740-39578_t
MKEENQALVPYSLNNPFGNMLALRERMFSVSTSTNSSINIRISQQYKPDGKGGTALGFGASVHHCAVVLAKYLEHQFEFYGLRGKQILELGCGTGFLSVLCSVMGAKLVIATDGDDLSVDLTRENFESNAVALSGAYVCSRLLWGNEGDMQLVHGLLRDGQSYPDVILAADVRGGTLECFSVHLYVFRSNLVYHSALESFFLCLVPYFATLSQVVAAPYAAAYEDFVRTLDGLCDTDTVVLLAYQRRHRDEDRCFELLAATFHVSRLPRSASIHPDFRQLPIFIFSLRKKQGSAA